MKITSFLSKWYVQSENHNALLYESSHYEKALEKASVYLRDSNLKQDRDLLLLVRNLTEDRIYLSAWLPLEGMNQWGRRSPSGIPIAKIDQNIDGFYGEITEIELMGFYRRTAFKARSLLAMQSKMDEWILVNIPTIVLTNQRF
jgi:hypothetical protein